ncbi:DUF4169 family protein [Roseobacteraceae bacterium S113]
MSDKPVNLNQFRKQKARAQKRARGDANAAKFGRTKAEQEKTSKIQSLDASRLDGHALQKPHSSDKSSKETP